MAKKILIVDDEPDILLPKIQGADDYILKPFEPADLLFKIKKLIG